MMKIQHLFSFLSSSTCQRREDRRREERASLAAAKPFLLLVGLFFASTALAQSPVEQVRFAKKTIVNFDDDVIEGRILFSIIEKHNSRRRTRHASILRVRNSFSFEVLKSIGDL